MFEQLKNEIISKSQNDTWHDAVNEWEVEDCEEDEERNSSCICGKEEIRYLFTIKNIYNENILFPIGSSCIKKFSRSELTDIVDIKEKMFKLFHAVENNVFITLSTEYFSKKLLKHLYDKGVFKANEYNGYDSETDYQFMIKMFLKKNKGTISAKQERKIKAIIMGSIRPFLIKELKFRKGKMK